MRYNKLIGLERTKDLLSQGLAGHDINTRRTGKTLSSALITIGKAMDQPGSAIKFEDHFGTRRASDNLQTQINWVIHNLGLKFLSFPERHHLRYDLYADTTEATNDTDTP